MIQFLDRLKYHVCNPTSAPWSNYTITIDMKITYEEIKLTEKNTP